MPLLSQSSNIVSITLRVIDVHIDVLGVWWVGWPTSSSTISSNSPSNITSLLGGPP